MKLRNMYIIISSAGNCRRSCSSSTSSSSSSSILVVKVEARYSYIERLTGTKPDQPRFTIIEVAVDRQESMVLQR